MTENKVGDYEGIQSGLQQTHIIIVIVIASAAQRGNPLRPTLPPTHET